MKTGDAVGRSQNAGGYSARGVRGAGGSGRRAVWRWAAPLAAATAVVAVIATAVAVGGVSHSPAPRPAAISPTVAAAASPAKPAPRKTAAPSYPPDLEAGLIGFFLPATGAQYSTGALFTGEYRSLQGTITSECMVRLGFKAPGTESPAEIARAFWDLTQFPDLAAIAKAGTLPGYSMGATPPESEAYQAAFAHCQTAGMKPFTGMVNADMSFGNPFISTITQIQASAPVTATLPALGACATRYVDGRDEQAGQLLGQGVRAMRAPNRRDHGEAAANRAGQVPGRASAPVPGAREDRPRGLRPRPAARPRLAPTADECAIQLVRGS